MELKPGGFDARFVSEETEAERTIEEPRMFENTISTLVTVSTRISRDAECLRQLTEIRDAEGFQHAAYGFLNTFRLQLPVCSTIGEDWWRHYFQQGFMNSDPIIPVLSESRKPTQISKMRQSPEFRKIWVDAGAEFDLEAPSLGVPMFGPCGETAVVLLFGDRLPRYDYERRRSIRRLARMAGEFHDQVMKHMNCEALLGLPTLGEREKTCLYLASTGGSSQDIADEMSVSKKTVEMHLKSCRNKLNARNTVQAVARAVHMGLIRSS